MPIISMEQLSAMCTSRISAAQRLNMASMAIAINNHGHYFGMNKLYNLAAFLGQVLVESGEFRYDRELWGPTKQQLTYEGARRLGNTQKGDGSKFRGYGPIQLTGRYNVTQFYKWALANHKKFGAPVPPNFVDDPAKIVTDPWEGLSALWYWHIGNPEKESLNKYAADNNQTMITRRVNGGLTHFANRLDCQARAALVLLGYGISKNEVKRFQADHSSIAGTPDGVIGDKTRNALHIAMSGQLPITSVEEKSVYVPVPVPTDDVDKPWYKDAEGVKEVVTTIGAPTLLSFFTDIPMEKLLFLTALLAAGGLVWYLIRRSRLKETKVAMQDISNQPSTEVVRTRNVIKDVLAN
jgi:putative chitinase